MKLALALVAVAGCDKVLGLNAVSGVDAPPPDGPTQLVSGDMAVLAIRNDPSFAPEMVTTPISASDVSVTASLGDGKSIPVTIGDGGTLAFQTPVGATYTLELQRSVDAIPTILVASTPTFAFRAIESDRPGAQLAHQQTILAFMISNPPAVTPSPFAAIASTGIRAYLAPESGDADHPELDWAHSGRGLPDGNEHDELYYQRWQTLPAGYAVITDYLRISLTLGDGFAVTVNSPSSPLAANLCVHVKTQRPDDVNFLRQHSLATAFTDAWAISGVPVPALGVAGALPVVQSGIAGAADDLDVGYGTPYPADGGEMASVGVGGTRLIQLPISNIPFFVADTIGYFTAFTPATGSSCPTNVVQPDTTPIALASTVSVAGTLLIQDGQQVMIDRSMPVPFAYTLTSNDYDDVIVTLFEVVNVGIAPITETSVIAIRQYFAPSPVAIDAALLAKNHYYVITVAVRVGFPNARMLDYRVVQFPAATSRVWTAMFQVAN